MNPREQAKKDIEEIWNIIHITNECLDFCKYLNYPPTESERKYLSINSANARSFNLIKVVLWRYVIIEFAKLFSAKDGDAFNLKKFIEKCNSGNHYHKIQIDTIVIDKWNNFLKENEIIINKIITLRDKVFAHRDRNHEDVLKSNEIFFKELEPLVAFTRNIIREVYVKFGADVFFDIKTHFDKELYSVLTDLAEYQPIKEKAIFDKYMGRLDP